MSWKLAYSQQVEVGDDQGMSFVFDYLAHAVVALFFLSALRYRADNGSVLRAYGFTLTKE